MHLCGLGLDLLVQALVASLHLLLVPDQGGKPVQGPRVHLVSVAPHHPTQLLGLSDYLGPGL